MSRQNCFHLNKPKIKYNKEYFQLNIFLSSIFLYFIYTYFHIHIHLYAYMYIQLYTNMLMAIINCQPDYISN